MADDAADVLEDMLASIREVVGSSSSFEDLSERLAGYLPFLREIIEDPAEIWINWSINGNGRYGLRRYYLKRITLKGVSFNVVAETMGDLWFTFDLMRGRGPQPKNRQGLLVYGRP